MLMKLCIVFGNMLAPMYCADEGGWQRIWKKRKKYL